jgi:MoxR-like ATPase
VPEEAIASAPALPESVDATVASLARGDYLAARSLATAVFLALRLGRPLFLEGETGVGKTEIARVLARVLGRDLLRLQCYEGLDLASAAYEWNYPRQLLAIRLTEAGAAPAAGEGMPALYAREFLVERPLLRAVAHRGPPPVLLIDELDRADEPFEAFLLELLADYQITIPELGTVRAAAPPIVIITSNRTREIHDALKRRCFYHWLDFPEFETERRILALKAPAAAADLSMQIVAYVQALRRAALFKAPGVSETIDWAHALVALDAMRLTPQLVEDTLGTLLKYQDDIARIRGSEAARLLREIEVELAGSRARPGAGSEPGACT